jgi:hypothetical protein
VRVQKVVHRSIKKMTKADVLDGRLDRVESATAAVPVHPSAAAPFGGSGHD